MNRPTRVIKLGGNLLDDPGLIPTFRRWLDRQAPAANLLIVGGGKLADAIREADRLHGLGPTTAHWLAIRAMSIQAELVAGLLPQATFLRQWNELRGGLETSGIVIFDPESFLRHSKAADCLPCGWDVTSDSIAAYIAVALGSSELVLLKSRLPDPPHHLVEAARQAYVDRYFPVAAANVPMVRCVDLRGEDLPEVCLAR